MENAETVDCSGFTVSDEDILSIPEQNRFTIKNGLNISDTTKGVIFELDPEEDLTFENEDKPYFDDIDLFSNVKCEDSDAEEDEENAVDDNLSPFEALAKEMKPIEENGLVLKKEMKPGHGAVIPEKSLVIMHYSSYLEYIDEPFDSTSLRNIPFRFVLGKGNVIPGLDIAVSTMKKGEYSQFLIKPQYAYGEMGCPPRIPQNATILCKVEIIKFFDSAAAIEFEEMTPEDKKKASFEKVLQVCKMDHQLGNECFKENRYEPAIAKYRKAVKVMEDISLCNEEQDKQRQNLLLKLYLNLSLCFIKVSKAQPAISNARRALEIDSNNTKALFNLGKAFTLIADFGSARKYYYRARKNEPQNKEISQAILIMEEKETHALMLEKNLCKRMFQQEVSESKNVTLPSHDSDLSQESKNSIMECLKNFKDNPDLLELPFSIGFSAAEKGYIKTVSGSLGLKFVEKKIDCINQMKIMK